MTEQEIFDTVADHLLTQNAKSEDWTRAQCLYRGPDGRKCAVGCLITDEEYKPSMETKRVGLLIERDLSRFAPFKNLLGDLQWIHDEYEVESWNGRLLALAVRYGLSTAVLSKYGSVEMSTS